MKLITLLAAAAVMLFVSPANARPHPHQWHHARDDSFAPPMGFIFGWHGAEDDWTVFSPRRHHYARHHRHERKVVHRTKHKYANHETRPRAVQTLRHGATRTAHGTGVVSVPPVAAELPLPAPQPDPGPSPPSDAANPIAGLIQGIFDTISLALDRAYLVSVSRPGYTMERQGAWTAIERLNPIFARRLAGAIREARAAGIDVCIFSAYRPPAYGVGGFADKFDSAHAYGLAADVCGIGDPGSREAIRWRVIAARHGVYGPYSVYSRSEWNHMEPCMSRAVTRQVPALRRTITASGPKILEAMWRVGERIVASVGLSANIDGGRGYAAARRHHYSRRRRYAGI